jgi:hypothetical protein
LFIFMLAADLVLTVGSKGRLSGGAACTVFVWVGVENGQAALRKQVAIAAVPKKDGEMGNTAPGPLCWYQRPDSRQAVRATMTLKNPASREALHAHHQKA